MATFVTKSSAMKSVSAQYYCPDAYVWTESHSIVWVQPPESSPIVTDPESFTAAHRPGRGFGEGGLIYTALSSSIQALSEA